MTTYNESRHGQAIGQLGLHANISPRLLPMPTEARFVSMVVTDGGRQVAFFRCEPTGEWSGWGWVEHANTAGRREFRAWSESLTALQRHPSVVGEVVR